MENNSAYASKEKQIKQAFQEFSKEQEDRCVIQEQNGTLEQDSVDYSQTRYVLPRPYEMPVIPFNEQINESQIFELTTFHNINTTQEATLEGIQEGT